MSEQCRVAFLAVAGLPHLGHSRAATALSPWEVTSGPVGQKRWASARVPRGPMLAHYWYSEKKPGLSVHRGVDTVEYARGGLPTKSANLVVRLSRFTAAIVVRKVWWCYRQTTTSPCSTQISILVCTPSWIRGNPIVIAEFSVHIFPVTLWCHIWVKTLTSDSHHTQYYCRSRHPCERVEIVIDRKTRRC